MKMFPRPWQLEVACWDNDEDVEENENEDVEENENEASKKPSEKTFTQAELDKIVTTRVKNLKTQLKTTEGNYQKLLEQKGLSEEQRAAIEADLENVRAQMRTKEQQLAHDRKKDQEKYNAALEVATGERDRYKSMFEESTITREITDAAAKEGAFDPSQFVDLLHTKAKMVEELSPEGEKTGRLVPRVEWEVTNPETKQSERVLKAPAEVIELMKDNTQRYGNLFKSNVAKGLGGNATPAQGGTGKVDVSKMSPEEYMAFRNTPEGTRALGLRR